MNRKFKLDKLTVIFTFMLALCAVVLMIFMMNIIDRSADHVSQIKKVNVVGVGSNFTDALVTESELARFSISDEHTDHPACHIADHKCSLKDFDRVAAIKNLRQFTLKRCEFEAPMLDKIVNAPIQSLRISECDLDKAMIERFSKLKKLHHVEFYKCDFEPKSLAALQSPDLHWLQVRECHSTGQPMALGPDDFEGLKSLKTLNRLELERTRMQPGTIRTLAKTTVILLNCAHCALTDQDLSDAAKIPYLDWIDVSHNDAISCVGLKSLLDAPKIGHIKADFKNSNCKFTPAELERLARKSFKPPDWLSRKSG